MKKGRKVNLVQHTTYGDMCIHIVLDMAEKNELVGLCNDITVVDVLVSWHYLCFSLREEIREFANNLQIWLRESLAEVPAAVRDAKLKGNSASREAEEA